MNNRTQAPAPCERQEGKPCNMGDYFRVEMCAACKAKVEGWVFAQAPSAMVTDEMAEKFTLEFD